MQTPSQSLGYLLLGAGWGLLFGVEVEDLLGETSFGGQISNVLFRFSHLKKYSSHLKNIINNTIIYIIRITIYVKI